MATTAPLEDLGTFDVTATVVSHETTQDMWVFAPDDEGMAGGGCLPWTRRHRRRFGDNGGELGKQRNAGVRSDVPVD